MTNNNKQSKPFSKEDTHNTKIIMNLFIKMLGKLGKYTAGARAIFMRLLRNTVYAEKRDFEP